MGSWRTLRNEQTEIIREGSDGFLRLRRIKLPDKPAFEGNVWSMVMLPDGVPHKATITLVAKSTSENNALNVHIDCMDGKTHADAPYGVLASNAREFQLSPVWSTHELVIPVPADTRKMEIVVIANALQTDDDTVDLRSVEYIIE